MGALLPTLTSAPLRTMEAPMSMTEHRPRRHKISTRIEVAALSTIERVAAEQRTTPAHVARVWLEDAARSRPAAGERTAGA
jgi:hypothetical protein